MKVFISWSGETSHKVALALHEWLPSVIQAVHPYVSSEDIEKGKRWSTDIAAELGSSEYGIICLTKENLHMPWINFEAGALGKSVETSRVSPFLFRLKRSEVTGPLVLFQSTLVDKADMLKLLKSINAANSGPKLSDQVLASSLEVWWPILHDKLNAIVEKTSGSTAPLNPVSAEDAKSKMFEEILELTRRNHKLLTAQVEGRLPHLSASQNHQRQVERYELMRSKQVMEAFEVSVAAIDSAEKQKEFVLHQLSRLAKEIGPNELLKSSISGLQSISSLHHVLKKAISLNDNS